MKVIDHSITTNDIQQSHTNVKVLLSIFKDIMIQWADVNRIEGKWKCKLDSLNHISRAVKNFTQVRQRTLKLTYLLCLHPQRISSFQVHAYSNELRLHCSTVCLANGTWDGTMAQWHNESSAYISAWPQSTTWLQPSVEHSAQPKVVRSVWILNLTSKSLTFSLQHYVQLITMSSAYREWALPTGLGWTYNTGQPSSQQWPYPATIRSAVSLPYLVKSA